MDKTDSSKQTLTGNIHSRGFSRNVGNIPRETFSRDIDLGGHLVADEGTEITQQRQSAFLNIRYYKPSTPDSSLPTVIFLPYWGGSAVTFEPVQLQLSETHPSHISIAVSYQGTGSSAWQETSSLTSLANQQDLPENHDIPALAADVLALLENLESDDDDEGFTLIPSRKIVLCAHSMSAKVAWEVLDALTGRFDTGTNLNNNKRVTVTGLTLLAPAPPGPLELPAEMREQQLKAYDSIESARWTLENVLTHKKLVDRVIERLAGDCAGMSTAAKKGWVELGMKSDCLDAVREVAARLEGPDGVKDFQVRVLVGEEDKVETFEKVRRETVDVLNELGFTVVLRVVGGSGHLLPVEAPDEIVVELGMLL